jgi:uncharacterized membrane protein
MKRILSSGAAALIAGLAVSGVLLTLFLGLWLLNWGLDGIGFVSLVLRWIHVLGGILWVGMIWFVNFTLFKAIDEADAAGRAMLHKVMVPRVAQTFRHASHLTVVSGALLLASTGYVLDRWVFLSAVYIPPLRSALLWSAAAAGIAMWIFVHFIIWPSLQVVLGERPGDDAGKARAREQVRMYARINLILAIPVTLAMVAATHLY